MAAMGTAILRRAFFLVRGCSASNASHSSKVERRFSGVQNMAATRRPFFSETLAASLLARLPPHLNFERVHPVPYTLHSKPYTLHPKPYTLNPTP